KSLKGKNLVEKDVPPNNANVIASGMFKLNLKSLSPKLLKNRDAHIDYIKHTHEHADTLWKIVKHARALRPLDNDLDSACKWLPIGRTFTIDGTKCPLTRITSTRVVPLKETSQTPVTIPNPPIKVYRRSSKVAKSVKLSSKPSTLGSRWSKSSSGTWTLVALSI
ncbi:hypothetical protein Tco_0037361, partial [Tanacetum coccineum]